MSVKSHPFWLFAAGVAAGAAVLAGAYAVVGPAFQRGPVAEAPPGTVWTCSMHPQIRMARPGRCPICGMDLVPVLPGGAAGEAAHPSGHLALGEHARRMASVETVAVEERELFKEIRTVGRVDFDETRVKHIAARVNGRVDEVFANFPGIVVKEGDHLVNIYSPDLLASQEEYLLSLRSEKVRQAAGAVPDRSFAASARERLRLWGLTEEQLDDLARTGKARTHVTYYAPLGGTIVRKDIREGQYVKEGDSLYTIADLTHVWLILEVYEYERSWVNFGQAVQVTLEGQPAAVLTGSVGFVEPVLNDATRTVQVRVILKNEGGKLLPGMYAQALIRVPILPDGTPGPTGLEGKYACPMHPYITSERPGECPVCRMPLELVPGRKDDAAKGPFKVLAVPAEAVLTTGWRWLVYAEERPGEYRLVEPRLGPRAGDFYPVLSGLSPGQRVVARGNFLLDSQFQITGKPSLLYPEGAGGAAGHAGHGAPAPPEAQAPKHEGH
jgi:Cu(I)/Ag(I) efflux system membrane fusion protein